MKKEFKFTAADIAALTLPPGKAELFAWDPTMPGFGVRARRTAKTWVIQYRFDTRQRRESLGDIRKVTLEDARKIAKKRFAQIELGTDPAFARKRGLTVGQTIDRCLDSKVLRPNTLKGSRIAKAHWKPLLDRPLTSVKLAEVAELLQNISKEHGRSTAQRARSLLSATYAWAMTQGLCESNPVVGTLNPTAGLPSRERVLSDHELALLWRAAGDDIIGAITKMLIITGCRRDEIGLLEWSEVDLNTGKLIIPGERTKSKRTLILSLPPVAIDILRSVRRMPKVLKPGKPPDEKYVFGGPGKNWSHAKLVLDNRLLIASEGKPVAAWRLHDLRRSMRSNLGKLGIAPHISELAIGHSQKGIIAIYDKHKYESEIADALLRWSEYVTDLVERNPKVVPLRGAS